MENPSEMSDKFANRRKSFLIASPIEDEKILRTKKCTEEGVRAGAKAAAVACVASTVPTLVAVRKIPWAKANLNYTAQALIISGCIHCSILHYCRQNHLGVCKEKYTLQIILRRCNNSSKGWI